MSVDFVTRAGRGAVGPQVLESAHANRRAIDRGISEATVNDTREALNTVLREAYGAGENTWLYVRDFDDTTVWFEIEGRGADDAGIYGQTFTNSDGVVALTGPAPRCASRPSTSRSPGRTAPSPPPRSPRRTTWARSRSRRPSTPARREGRSGRQAPGGARRREGQEQDARGGAAGRTRGDRAAALLLEHRGDVEFTPLETRGLLSELPVKEGALDEEAFTTRVKTEAARVAEAGGAGRIRGFGGTPPGGAPISWDDIDKIGQEA
jgi:hypothetical protein